MNPDLLDLNLQGLLGGFNSDDLLAGPKPSLGTQVWVYDSSKPAPENPGDPDQRFIDLTDPANQDPTKPTVGPGFGNPANKYSWSSAIYNGELYVGTFNAFLDFRGLLAVNLLFGQATKVGRLTNLDIRTVFQLITNNPFFPTLLDSQGGEIWKYTPGVAGDPGSVGGSWSKVYDAAEVPELGADVTGFRSMVVFEGKLYAASSSSLIFDVLAINQDQPATISVYDGTSWSRLSGGPLDNVNNASIRTMKVVGDTLLIGTENSVEGAQLWGLSPDGGWTQFTNLPGFTFTDIPNTSDLTDLFGTGPVKPAATGDIVNLDEYGLSGKFLVGTWQPYGLYMGDANNTVAPFTPIILPENLLIASGGGLDNGVMKMEIYNGYLYVGSVNYTGGTSLLRVSIESLKQITPENAAVKAALLSDWEVVTSDGFKNINDHILGNDVVEAAVLAGGSNGSNGISTYSWSMKVMTGADGKQRLYVGDFSSTEGTARLYSILDEGIAGTEEGNLSSFDNPFKDDVNPTVTISLVTDQFGPEAYGLRTMQAYTPSNGLSQPPTNGVTSNKLIIGDADPFDAEVGLLTRLDPTRKVRVLRDGSGGEGDDILFGTLSNNTIRGLEGEDIVVGFSGADTLYGDDDQDILIGGIGRDRLHGGGQSDLIWGDLPSLGAESLAESLMMQLRELFIQAVTTRLPAITSNTALSDAITRLTNSNPALRANFVQLQSFGANWGESEFESLRALPIGYRASVFDDVLYGNQGEDILIGGLGADTLHGGQHNDILIGQAGHDYLHGDKGEDQLEGGRGRDLYYGGLGADIYDLRITDSDSNLVPDGERDTIVFRKQDFEDGMTVVEKVFGFESGIDKVSVADLAKSNVIVNTIRSSFWPQFNFASRWANPPATAPLSVAPPYNITLTGTTAKIEFVGVGTIELMKADQNPVAWTMSDFIAI